jgi:uncharacterized Ntn-hydrolase superfamily protein
VTEDQFPLPTDGRSPSSTAKGILRAYGSQCATWAGDRQGKNWSAQGNILVGPQVVEAMGRAFEATEGDCPKSCSAATQGGRRPGGDSRGKQSASML